MKHTSGPWKYSTNVGPTKALIVEADGSTVVELVNRTHDSRFLANVRLIAGAPDLLEALQVLVRKVDGTLQGYGILVDVLDAARAAIARAEGAK